MWYCDRRLGGIERWSLGKPKDYDMRINDLIEKCVCFLCHKEFIKGDPTYVALGTAFFVVLGNYEDKFSGSLYFVTAKHLVDEPRAEEGLFARINSRDGKVVVVPVPMPDRWVKAD